jgi:hypothetical protein
VLFRAALAATRRHGQQEVEWCGTVVAVAMETEDDEEPEAVHNDLAHFRAITDYLVWS